LTAEVFHLLGLRPCWPLPDFHLLFFASLPGALRVGSNRPTLTVCCPLPIDPGKPITSRAIWRLALLRRRPRWNGRADAAALARVQQIAKPLTKADAIEANATILYMFGESDYADEFYRKLAGKILKVLLPDNQAVAAVRREKPPGRSISPASILPNKLCNSSELLSSANLEKGSTSRHLFPILHLRLSAVSTGKSSGICSPEI
jgi:hypothetical protein